MGDADFGVDGTYRLPGALHTEAMAAVAADAGNHILAPALENLLAVLAVADERTAKADHIAGSWDREAWS